MARCRSRSSSSRFGANPYFLFLIGAETNCWAIEVMALRCSSGDASTLTPMLTLTSLTSFYDGLLDSCVERNLGILTGGCIG